MPQHFLNAQGRKFIGCIQLYNANQFSPFQKCSIIFVHFRKDCPESTHPVHRCTFGLGAGAAGLGAGAAGLGASAAGLGTGGGMAGGLVGTCPRKLQRDDA